MAATAQALRGRDYATAQRGGGGLARRPLHGPRAFLAYAVVFGVLAIVLAPHAGLVLLSLATVWSFSPLPDGYTLAHYARIMGDSATYVSNTLLYAGLAAALDVVVGGAIAWLVLRTRLPGRHLLDWTASAALAVPGVVLGIGYLRAFYGVTLPGGVPFATFWVAIVLAIAIRRLPYAMRAAHAALQQISVSLEEAAENLGATRGRAARRIVVPLMTGGLLAGFVTSFATATVELAAVLMLVQNNSDAPLSYGIYVLMQTPAGRGAGAALGVVAVAIVALCMGLAQLLAGRAQRNRGLEL
jgi:iron(III) transport system permease protein